MNNTIVPESVKKRFNWGAFFLTWIWGLGNQTYITLTYLISTVIFAIPLVNFIVPLGLAIWFGIKGNEWAWQNANWQSEAHFHDVQKKWATAGVVVCVTLIVLSILISVLGLAALMTSGSGAS